MLPLRTRHNSFSRCTIFARIHCNHLRAVVEHSSITVLRSATHYPPHQQLFLFYDMGLQGKKSSQICTYHRQISFTSTRPLPESKAIISGGCAEADVLDICFLILPPFFFFTGSGDGMSPSSCMSAKVWLAFTFLKHEQRRKWKRRDVRVYPCN